MAKRKQTSMTMIVLLLVLVVSVIAVIGLFKQMTGAVITTTSYAQSRYCDCYGQRTDYMGNDMGIQWLNELRVKTAGQHTDSACNSRCQTMRERGKSRGTKQRIQVIGYARPMGAPPGSGWHAPGVTE